MEVKSKIQKATVWIKKYKYVALVIIIGVLFMLTPTGKAVQKSNEISRQNDIANEDTIEDKLTEILSQIRGAGKVKVMLTVGAGEEIIYQTNEDVTNTSDSTKIKKEVVTVTNADREQTGLVRQTLSQTYLGAIIICQGADDPQTKLEITEAVCRITGLKSNCISVLKMK